MREAMTVRAGRDVAGIGRPRRSPAPSKFGGALRRCAGLLARHRGLVAGSAVTLAAVAAVAVNALSWQQASHPAPLFGGRRESPAGRKVDLSAQIPPARPASITAPVPVSPPVPPARMASRDGIGDAIRATETGSIAPGRPEPQTKVAAAQRALTKLGFGPLKADGVMGSGTRDAIERFERSRNLPVSGELGARTLRSLAAQSGLPIE